MFKILRRLVYIVIIGVSIGPYLIGYLFEQRYHAAILTLNKQASENGYKVTGEFERGYFSSYATTKLLVEGSSATALSLIHEVVHGPLEIDFSKYSIKSTNLAVVYTFDDLADKGGSLSNVITKVDFAGKITTDIKIKPTEYTLDKRLNISLQNFAGFIKNDLNFSEFVFKADASSIKLNEGDNSLVLDYPKLDTTIIKHKDSFLATNISGDVQNLKLNEKDKKIASLKDLNFKAKTQPRKGKVVIDLLLQANNLFGISNKSITGKEKLVNSAKVNAQVSNITAKEIKNNLYALFNYKKIKNASENLKINLKDLDLDFPLGKISSQGDAGINMSLWNDQKLNLVDKFTSADVDITADKTMAYMMLANYMIDEIEKGKQGLVLKYEDNTIPVPADISKLELEKKLVDLMQEIVAAGVLTEKGNKLVVNLKIKDENLLINDKDSVSLENFIKPL